MMSTNLDGARALASARALHRHLHQLGQAAAPGSLLGAVLDEIGLAERYLSLAGTPIGTVYVAFIGEGGQGGERGQDGDGSLRICGVAPALDDASFERTYRA